MVTELARLRPGVRRKRAATWDRSGRNDDFVRVPAGETVVLAEDEGPGQLTHVWLTLRTADLWWGRHLVLRAYWDGEDSPSVEVPLGDFLGAGNAVVAPFSSALLAAAPRDGLAFHCWFPMPFADGFRLTVENQGPLPVLALYVHVDYELWPEPQPDLGRFHAWWHRERRTAPAPTGTYAHAVNLTGEANHLLLDTVGRGHYVGTALYLQSDLGGWWGEGDDMFFVDGDVWPPTVHGTGTEDYFGTAWSPAEAFSHPFYGQPVAQREDWAGFSSLYRFHVADPIPFERSLRASIEHGHANDRGDDWASVAYWYQLDRPAPLPALPPVADREPPWPAPWRDRVLAIREVFHDLDVRRQGAAASYLTQHAVRWDGDGVDRALTWLREGPRSLPAATRTVDEALQEWVARFDADEAAQAAVTIGWRVDGRTWQLVIGSGACVLREGAEGHERLTLTMSGATFVAWTFLGLDPWEALLRGDLQLAGDGDLALRLPGLFPPS